MVLDENREISFNYCFSWKDRELVAFCVFFSLIFFCISIDWLDEQILEY